MAGIRIAAPGSPGNEWNIYWAGRIRSLRDWIDRRVPSVLKQIGAFLLGRAQAAFTDQRFDGKAWAERYPRQRPPRLNVAGAIQDFARTSRLKKRRFEPRPAGMDTGSLRRSMSFRATPLPKGGLVEVGSVLPYAGRVQFGGESRQPITATIKANMAKFLRSKQGRGFRPKLGPLFRRETLITKAGARPFIGIRPGGAIERRLVQIVTEGLQPPQGAPRRQ